MRRRGAAGRTRPTAIIAPMSDEPQKPQPDRNALDFEDDIPTYRPESRGEATRSTEAPKAPSPEQDTTDGETTEPPRPQEPGTAPAPEEGDTTEPLDPGKAADANDGEKATPAPEPEAGDGPAAVAADGAGESGEPTPETPQAPPVAPAPGPQRRPRTRPAEEADDAAALREYFARQEAERRAADEEAKPAAEPKGDAAEETPGKADDEAPAPAAPDEVPAAASAASAAAAASSEKDEPAPEKSEDERKPAPAARESERSEDEDRGLFDEEPRRTHRSVYELSGRAAPRSIPAREPTPEPPLDEPEDTDEAYGDLFEGARSPEPTRSLAAAGAAAEDDYFDEPEDHITTEPPGEDEPDIDARRGTIDLGLLLLRLGTGLILVVQAIAVFFQLGEHNGVVALQDEYGAYAIGDVLGVAVPALGLAAGIFLIVGLLFPVFAAVATVVTGFGLLHEITELGAGLDVLAWGPEIISTGLLFGIVVVLQLTGPGRYGLDYQRSWARRPLASSWGFLLGAIVALGLVWVFGAGVNPLA